MNILREAAMMALEALELAQTDVHWELNSPTRKFLRKAEKTLRAALAQKDEPVQEPDLSRCPQCGGIADNGHDRSIPPNPYLCTKCMAEMPRPSYNVTVVDDAHPNGIPLEQWQNKPVQEPVAWKLWDENPEGGGDWRYYDAKDFKEGIDPMKYFDGLVPLYTAPPQRQPMQEQVIEDAIEAAYWHFDARKKGLNEWASAPQSERDAFKAEARKLVRGYFPTRQAQDTKREMLAVADAFIRGKRAARIGRNKT